MVAKGWSAILGIGMVLGTVLLPYGALAQPGYYITPSFGFTELYNDNVFYTSSNRKADFISRFSPGILGGYESEPLTLLAGYTFDGEIFAHRTELNTAMARQSASLNFRHLPNRALTLSMRGEYAETQTPGELNLLTGLPTGRERGDRFLVDPSIAYRFDRLTAGRVGYTFTKDDFAGVTTDTHVGKVGFDRRITASDTGSLEYTFRQSVFNGDDITRAHVLSPSWTHEFTPLTSFTLRAGPRFSEGFVDADVSASIRYRPKPGEVSLVYSRSQATALGVRGTTRTNSVTLLVKYRLLPLLEISASPSYFRSTLANSVADVYRAKLDATYEITRWLSLVGFYEFAYQNGILTGTPGATGRHDNISNNIVLLSLVAKFRTRVN